MASIAIFWTFGTLAATFVLDANLALRFPYAADLTADYATKSGPLVVALGSSRTAGSLEINRFTAYLNESLPDRQFTVFNAAVPDSGLMAQEEILNHLLAVGPKPEFVLIELYPEYFRNNLVKLHRDLTWGKVFQFGHELFRKQGAKLAENRLLPLFSRRFEVRLALWRWGHRQLGFVPPKLDPLMPDVPIYWDDFVVKAVDPTPMTKAVEAKQIHLIPKPLGPFARTICAGGALERMLAVCQERDIPALIVASPICSRSRTSFDPAMEGMRAYIDSLLERHPKARFHDALAALPDNAFLDDHHVNAYGQHLMCRRLSQSVLPTAIASWERGRGVQRMARSSGEQVIR